MKLILDERMPTRAVQLATGVLTLALILSVAAPGTSLSVAPLTVENRTVVQAVTVQNNYFRALRFIEVACDFWSGNRIVHSASVTIRDLGLFATGEGLVTGRRGFLADRTDCRIVGAE